MDVRNEEQAITQSIDRLAERFVEVPRSHIEELVRTEQRGFVDSSVRDYIPVLIEHAAKDRLRQETGISLRR